MKIFLSIIIAIIIFLGSTPNLYSALSSNPNSTDLESGSTQFWSITDASQTGLDFTGDLTFAMWIRFESLVGTNTLINKRQGTGNNRSYEFLWDASNIVQFYSSTNGTAQGCGTFDWSWTPSANTWYHVAVTKSGTTVKFWVDAAQVGADGTCTDGTIFNGASPFRIGNRVDVDNLFDGLIDDVRVWSRALSSTEISDLKSGPCTFDDGASLQGQWLFDNNGNDATANANNLTNNNSATFSTTVAYACAAAAVPVVPPVIFFE